MSRLDRAAWSETYPNVPGHVHSSRTSKAAAESIKPKLGRLHEIVLHSFRTWPTQGFTDDELQILLGGPTVWRPRRIELTAQGYLKDGGRKRKTTRGKQAVVWTLA